VLCWVNGNGNGLLAWLKYALLYILFVANDDNVVSLFIFLFDRIFFLCRPNGDFVGKIKSALKLVGKII
jgi:hypothetical protein